MLRIEQDKAKKRANLPDHFRKTESMRQDIAYILIAAMVLGIAIWWRIALVRSRRGRRGSIRVDLFKKDDADL